MTALILTFAIYATAIVAVIVLLSFTAYRCWLHYGPPRRAKGRYVPTPGRERLP